jgi:hypothetical protein
MRIGISGGVGGARRSPGAAFPMTAYHGAYSSVVRARRAAGSGGRRRSRCDDAARRRARGGQPRVRVALRLRLRRPLGPSPQQRLRP